MRLIFRILATIGGAVVGAVVLGIAARYLWRGHVPAHTVIVLDFEQPLVEYVPDDPLANLLQRRRALLRDVLDGLARAKSDDRVVGLVAHVGQGTLGLAQIQELRDAVADFRSSGKRAVAFAEAFGEFGPGNGAYYLATAFGEIYLQPSGDVGLTGLMAETPFVRGTLDKLGVVPRFGARGEYKNAVNTFTERRFTGPHREATSRLITSQFDQIVRGIAAARGLAEGDVRSVVDRAPLSAQQALDAKLVDGLAYRDEVLAKLEDGGTKPERLSLARYVALAGPPPAGGDTVALIHGVGAVSRGKSGVDPMSGDVGMGSETLAAAFRSAVEADRVRAIVFRIDSPGGSYVASDTIWREVSRAREAGKPVVVSMGNVAASGGYFVAVPADRIVAQPGTITGSIGVFAGKMLTGGLWDKLGVTWDEVHVGTQRQHVDRSVRLLAERARELRRHARPHLPGLRREGGGGTEAVQGACGRDRARAGLDRRGCARARPGRCPRRVSRGVAPGAYHAGARARCPRAPGAVPGRARVAGRPGRARDRIGRRRERRRAGRGGRAGRSRGDAVAHAIAARRRHRADAARRTALSARATGARMRRDIFTGDHDLFRSQVRRFVEKEVAPKVADWNARGMSDRDTWRRAGAEGLLGVCAPAEFGGAGADFLYAAIVNEEMARVRAHGMMLSLHADICLPYLLVYGTPEQKRRWAPGAVSGDVLLGIAMTEPGAGSDLAGIATTARRDGDTYVLNGAKTFISNGQIGDLFVVVAKTDPHARPAHSGVSLLLVEGTTPGFIRGKKLDKLGLRGQDTSELFFEDCRVPATQLLGREGQGFKMLMQQLQQERLVIAITAVASCRRALDDTVVYVKERRAFGKAIAAFQNTQFKLAELATQVEVGQAFVDRLLVAHVRGDDIVTEVSMAKWWTTDLQKRLTSDCVQLHGGYGFMLETPIAEDYADAAVQSIYAGTNEIMKVIIARRMGLGG